MSFTCNINYTYLINVLVTILLKQYQFTTGRNEGTRLQTTNRSLMQEVNELKYAYFKLFT